MQVSELHADIDIDDGNSSQMKDEELPSHLSRGNDIMHVALRENKETAQAFRAGHGTILLVDGRVYNEALLATVKPRTSPFSPMESSNSRATSDTLVCKTDPNPKTPLRRSTRRLPCNEPCSPVGRPSTGSSPKSKKNALYLNVRELKSTNLEDHAHFRKLPSSPTEASRPPPLSEAKTRRFNPLHWTTHSSTHAPPATSRSSIFQLIRSFGGIKLEVKPLSNELEHVATAAAGPGTDWVGSESWSPIRRAWRRTTSSSLSDSDPSLPYPLDLSSTSSSPAQPVLPFHVARGSSDEGLGGKFVLSPPLTIGDGHAGSETFGGHSVETEEQSRATAKRTGAGRLAEEFGDGFRDEEDRDEG
ncbi:hypothetical protein M407DRAFT_11113 [Tulasnella calospora MUT 4182]|uniref:Uncharacterized protein n=1 Tax=Tulasnella calospora MUT 4182 TaxID=1051891 RepID=A0A0C3Q8D3_9AGAM|nr:hypothetical protein M407DRAFT_11113 [Tulasnella calospora MUT 4182]